MSSTCRPRCGQAAPSFYWTVPKGRRRTESGWCGNRRRDPRPEQGAACSCCLGAVLGSKIRVDHSWILTDRLRPAGRENAAIAEHDDRRRNLEDDVHIVLDEHDRNLL